MGKQKFRLFIHAHIALLLATVFGHHIVGAQVAIGNWVRFGSDPHSTSEC